MFHQGIVELFEMNLCALLFVLPQIRCLVFSKMLSLDTFDIHSTL